MHRNQHISGFLFCHFFNQELICFCKQFRTVNFDHVIVWWGCTQITGTSYGMLTNNEDVPWGMRADEVDIPWGRRAPIRWTHNGTCAHIKGTSHIRSLTKEQSVRRFVRLDSQKILYEKEKAFGYRLSTAKIYRKRKSPNSFRGKDRYRGRSYRYEDDEQGKLGR